MTQRLLTLPSEALPGYEAGLRDVLDMLDRIAAQPAIVHLPTLRLVLEDRAAVLPGLAGAMPRVAAHPGWGPPAAWSPERDATLLEWADKTRDQFLLLDLLNAIPGDRVHLAWLQPRLDWLRAHRSAPLDAPTPAWPITDAARPCEAAAKAQQDGLADAVADSLAQPAPAAAPAPPPRLKQHKGEWTAERLALLDAEGPKTRPSLLLPRINALPGAPIASVGALRVKARERGAALDLGPIIERLAPGADPSDKAARAAARVALNGSGEWTTARLDLLRAEHGDINQPLATLLAKVNALPGNPIASVESMTCKARALGLKRIISQEERLARMRAGRHPKREVAATEPQEAAGPQPEIAAALISPTTNVAAKIDAPRTKPRKPEVTTPCIKAAMEAPLAPVAAQLNPWASTNPYRLTEEAEAEALAMLRQGNGAKALHEDFGGRLEWWQRWAGEKRQEGRAA